MAQRLDTGSGSRLYVVNTRLFQQYLTWWANTLSICDYSNHLAFNKQIGFSFGFLSISPIVFSEIQVALWLDVQSSHGSVTGCHVAIQASRWGRTRHTQHSTWQPTWPTRSNTDPLSVFIDSSNRFLWKKDGSVAQHLAHA